MMFYVVFGICVVLLVLILAAVNVFYTPVPGPIKEKWKFRAIFAAVQILNFLVRS